MLDNHQNDTYDFTYHFLPLFTVQHEKLGIGSCNEANSYQWQTSLDRLVSRDFACIRVKSIGKSIAQMPN